RRSKELELQEVLAPLRQRSSSEVTLSECDGEEVTAAASAELRAHPACFREYGSTSSINLQGISEQSFLEMLKEFRAEKATERGGGGSAGSSPAAGGKAEVRSTCREDAKEKSRWRSPRSDESIFKKLRSGRGDGEVGKEAGEEAAAPEQAKVWVCQKSFAHYDVQSMLFDLNAVASSRALVAQRRNTTTGASAASAGSGGSGASEQSFSSTEELSWKENLEHDLGDNTSNELLLSCPHFRNEIGGSGERDVSFSRATNSTVVTSGLAFQEQPLTLRPTNASISVLEVPKEQRRNLSRLRHHSVEHQDLGARYYRDHFHGK
ncbi:SI1L3 protein, partial [Bucco capensis]|nr:SI1L3 protein [Bucco capensis]